LRATWSEMDMKRAVNAVIVYGKSNVKASKQFGIPLETLRRKVLIAHKGDGVEKKLGRSTVLSAADEEQLCGVILQMESQYGRPKPPKFNFFKTINHVIKSINAFTLSVNAFTHSINQLAN